MYKNIALLTVLLLSACGYSFRGSGSVLPKDIQKVYIPLVQNRSVEPGLANLVTEALRDEFERYGAVYVVETANDADAILSATVLEVKNSSRSSTSNTDIDLQLENRMTIAADLKRINGTTLWNNPSMQVSRPYATSAGAVVTSSPEFASGSLSAQNLGGLGSREVSRAQEQQAFEELVEEVARRIYQQAVLPEF